LNEGPEFSNAFSGGMDALFNIDTNEPMVLSHADNGDFHGVRNGKAMSGDLGQKQSHNALLDGCLGRGHTDRSSIINLDTCLQYCDDAEGSGDAAGYCSAGEAGPPKSGCHELCDEAGYT
jgi:hypothetical protein